MRKTLLAIVLGFAFAAQAQTPATRIESRFETFSGSPGNSHSLVTGLRSGSEITLTGSGETATFTSPAKPMGYGNVTRALDLAQRQLAANGINDPTPTEIRTALMSGTIDGKHYEGILQMRADRMGWGQIAHAIGVHPGLGRPVATTTTTQSSGIVNAASGSPFTHANANGRALGQSNRPATTGAGSSAAGSAPGSNGNGAVRSAAAGGNGNAFGRSK